MNGRTRGTKMKSRRLIHMIEKHYAYHKVDIKLKLVSDSEDDERFIFRFKIKPGTKVNMILSCAPDIKAAMRIPLFYPFKDGEAFQ